MNFNIRIASSVCFLLFPGFLFAQISRDVYLTLNAQDQNRIERAADIFQKGFADMDGAIVYYESLPLLNDSTYDPKLETQYSIAMNKLRTVSNQFAQATELAYEVYWDGINDFWKNHNIRFYYTDGVMEAINMQKEGKNCFELSQLIREGMLKEKNFAMALSKHNVAYKLEVIALTYSVRALKRYQDFPVDYNYRWTNNFNFKEWRLKKKANEMDQRPAPIINLASSEEVIKTDTSKFIKDTVSGEQNYIVYRVQIAAHTTPISKSDLKNIYGGRRPVLEIQEEGWYKYQIGAFRSFAEASTALREVNVERAFISAYNNGRKMSLKLAKSLAP